MCVWLDVLFDVTVVTRFRHVREETSNESLLKINILADLLIFKATCLSAVTHRREHLHRTRRRLKPLLAFFTCPEKWAEGPGVGR